MILRHASRQERYKPFGENCWAWPSEAVTPTDNMFKKTRVNMIESDEGFSVEVLGRTGIKYKEGNKTLFIDSELLASSSPYGIALYTDSIHHWASPFEGELIEDLERQRIVDNVRRTFRFDGFEIQVI